MNKEFIEKTAFQRAYSSWFSEYERERRKCGRRKGDKIPGLPPPPTSPEDIGQALDRFGRREFMSICGVHRSTLARWENGFCAIPRPAWLLLVLLDQGRLPGMSEDWRDFRFNGDRLHLIGTRLSYSAREVAGWQYQLAHSEALARRVALLEARIEHLLQIGKFDSANAAFFAA